MNDFYTLKRFSRVLNQNIKHYNEVLSSGRVRENDQIIRCQSHLDTLKWSKKWVDNIRKIESDVKKGNKKNNETL
jgi:hypothetical protein